MKELLSLFFILLLLIYFVPAEPEEKTKDILNNTMPESKDTGEDSNRECVCLCLIGDVLFTSHSRSIETKLKKN